MSSSNDTARLKPGDARVEIYEDVVGACQPLPAGAKSGDCLWSHVYPAVHRDTGQLDWFVYDAQKKKYAAPSLVRVRWLLTGGGKNNMPEAWKGRKTPEEGEEAIELQRAGGQTLRIRAWPDFFINRQRRQQQVSKARSKTPKAPSAKPVAADLTGIALNDHNAALVQELAGLRAEGPVAETRSRPDDDDRLVQELAEAVAANERLIAETKAPRAAEASAEPAPEPMEVETPPPAENPRPAAKRKRKERSKPNKRRRTAVLDCFKEKNDKRSLFDWAWTLTAPQHKADWASTEEAREARTTVLKAVDKKRARSLTREEALAMAASRPNAAVVFTIAERAWQTSPWLQNVNPS